MKFETYFTFFYYKQKTVKNGNLSISNHFPNGEFHKLIEKVCILDLRKQLKDEGETTRQNRVPHFSLSFYLP